VFESPRDLIGEPKRKIKQKRFQVVATAVDLPTSTYCTCIALWIDLKSASITRFPIIRIILFHIDLSLWSFPMKQAQDEQLYTLTPKSSNSHKRSSEDCRMQTGEADEGEEYISIERSLKRMRVTSASPGELRLQRDLQRATNQSGWMQIGNSTWKAAIDYTWAFIRQSDAQPLDLYVEWGEWNFLLRIPKLYPHHPPVVAHLHQKGCAFRCNSIVFQAAPRSEDASEQDSVISGWNPLLGLDESLILLCKKLASWQPSAVFGMDFTPTSHATRQSPYSILPSFFPPNRFDVGYGYENAVLPRFSAGSADVMDVSR